MATTIDAVSFTVSVVGEKTSATFAGTFKAKPRLTHRDNLAKDRYRKELIGPDLENSTDRAVKTAVMIAELSVRLVDAPSWWKDNGSGLDLTDDAVLTAVFDGAMKVEEDAIEALKAEGEDAKAAVMAK